MQADAAQLDDPEMGDYHFAFLQEGEDGDLYDNIAEMRGTIDKSQ